MVSADRPRPLRLLLGRLFAISGVIVVAAAAAGGVAFAHLSNERQALLGRIDPANILVSQMLADYVDEETGVRGYALTGQGLFLDPYGQGRASVAQVDDALGRLLPPGSPAGRRLNSVRQRAMAWNNQFALPVVAAISAHNRVYASSQLVRGKTLFDSLRSSVTGLQQDLQAERSGAKANLAMASDQLLTVMIVSLAVIVLTGLVIWIYLRRLVLRPLAAVGADARTVTEGDLVHEVGRTGPMEVAELAADIDGMRIRILADVGRAQAAQEQLESTNAELARSNEDLEQFAYVASHDLQEPLRKVASFCQLLEQRYSGQLDERGEQYIAFAVDGAKRMQVLINDLLAFSRIGRTSEHLTEVALTDCLEEAERNVASAIESTGAEIGVDGELPVVLGDRTLLIALLQNLIGNAVKFHGDDPPRVAIGCGPSPDEADRWLLSVADNGIGIEPRFAERIFVIFQRLHGRNDYAGTGIGLAMCRKIVEFHGGHIWLDTAYSRGTRFCFTLPVPAPEESSVEPDTAEPADRPQPADA